MKLNIAWIVGFVDGEGCFSVTINPHKEMKHGVQVLPEFIVTQHIDDVQILHALKDYFKCGVVRQNHGNRWCYRVRGFNHLSEIIVPFFEKHILKTKKLVDFKKFRKIIMIMQNKGHLSPDGIESIQAILLKMNNRTKSVLKEI